MAYIAKPKFHHPGSDESEGPEDFKGVAALLASDASAFTTGQTIAVGGATPILVPENAMEERHGRYALDQLLS